MGNLNLIHLDRIVGSNFESWCEIKIIYVLLVGSSNVRRAKIAVDMAKQGKSIPGPFVSAYLPVMTMIDDIAQGGYTFVRLLQTIHSRAKNKR